MGRVGSWTTAALLQHHVGRADGAERLPPAVGDVHRRGEPAARGEAMMTTPIHPQVEAYLRQLDFALSWLRWDKRNEISSDTSAQIQPRTAAAGDGPGAVAAALQRAGDAHP